MLGMALNWKHQHEASIAEFERDIALNHYTDWRYASALVLAGEPERGIEVVEAHMRLDPFYLPTAPSWLGLGCYLLKQYPRALSALRVAVSRGLAHRPSPAIECFDVTGAQLRHRGVDVGEDVELAIRMALPSRGEVWPSIADFASQNVEPPKQGRGIANAHAGRTHRRVDWPVVDLKSGLVLAELNMKERFVPSRIATAEARCPITACERAARWARSRSFIARSRTLSSKPLAETAMMGSFASDSGHAFPR
jgi:hypothetical protein